MFWFQLAVAVALLAAVGWLAVGGGGHMSEPVADRPDLALPKDSLLARTDVDRVRFSVGVRGYRMDEVDDVLDRLAQEIESRERRIAELEGHPAAETDLPDVDDPATDEAAAAIAELDSAAPTSAADLDGSPEE
jgi:DivIVA domain-containing protein